MVEVTAYRDDHRAAIDVKDRSRQLAAFAKIKCASWREKCLIDD
jgi:hypothetical protein